MSKPKYRVGQIVLSDSIMGEIVGAVYEYLNTGDRQWTYYLKNMPHYHVYEIDITHLWRDSSMSWSERA